MADFAIPKLFVIPSTVTALAAKPTQSLLPGEFGIYKPDFTPTSAPAATDKYIFFAQGRAQATPLVGSSKSDLIVPSKVLNWVKESARTQAATQTNQVSGWHNIKCGDYVTVTIRLRSVYIDTAYYNGLTRSVTVVAPCCDCGADPCLDVDVEAIVDKFVIGINAEPTLKKYVRAYKIGTGTSAILEIDALPLTKYGTHADLHANPYEYDRMYFWVYITLGPDIYQDYATYDPCHAVAVSTITQRATYPTNGSDAIEQMDKYWWSYDQPPMQKELFRNPNFNSGYKTLVEPGIFYNLYTIRFKQHGTDNGFEDITVQSEQVTIAVPTGNAIGGLIETALTGYLGAPTNASPAPLTTSTTAAPVIPGTTTTTRMIP
jgi:hypothetical protein